MGEALRQARRAWECEEVPIGAEVVRQGGTVAAQNEATCVVYGMPRAVVDAGLPKAILPLDQFAPYLCKSMGIA